MKKLPDIKLTLASYVDSTPEKRFLGIRHCQYRAAFPGQEGESEPFSVDIVRRVKLDAVAIVAFYTTIPFRPDTESTFSAASVYLRSCLRPALFNRGDSGVGWEIPAGLIDPGETPAETAARECKEELGFDYPVDQFKELGHFVHSAVGLCGERIYFFSVRVNPKDQKDPTLDGSIMEEGAVIDTVGLYEAIRMCRAGDITDSKTEIGLLRLQSL